MSHWLNSNPELTQLLCPGEMPSSSADSGENYAVFQQTPMIDWNHLTLFNLISGPKQASGLFYTDHHTARPMIDKNNKQLSFASEFHTGNDGQLTFNISGERWILLTKPFVHARPFTEYMNLVNEH